MIHLIHDFHRVNPEMITHNLGDLSYDILSFERNFKGNENLTPEEARQALYRQCQKILPLFEKYDIHQMTPETSTIQHFQSDWDFYFWNNSDRDDKEDIFDTFTIGANQKRSVEANRLLFAEILAMLENTEIEVPNLMCRVVYMVVPDKDEIERRALPLCRKYADQMICLNGKKGRIRKVDLEENGLNSYGFFYGKARKRYFPIDEISVITQLEPLCNPA